MKKILFILLFAPFMLNAQTPAPLVDLSEYHDDNRIKEMTDLNFTNITDGTYQIPALKVTELDYAPPHASMAFADSAEVIACTEDLWSKVTGNAGALFVTIDQDDITVARDSITIEVDGDYMLVWNMSFRGTASDIWYARIRKNNVASAFQMQRRTANADTGNMGLNAYFDHMHAGDDLSFYIMNTADNDDMTLQASQVIIWMLHPR